MVAETIDLKRVFMHGKEKLQDPNPSMSPGEVVEFYSSKYPEFASAAIKRKETTETEIVYEIKTKIAENG